MYTTQPDSAPTPDNRRQMAGAAALALLIVAMFLASVAMRAQWIGCLGEPNPGQSINPEINSPIGIGSVNRWLDESTPIHHLVMTVFPSLFERKTPGMRGREIAYFPLTWIPLYAYARIAQTHLEMKHMQAASLACQLFTALPIGLLAYAIAAGFLEVLPALLIGVAAATFLLFLPGAMYLFLYCYFPDIAVLPFFSWLVLLEFLRDASDAQSPHRRKLSIAIAALLFFGPLIEWIMYVLPLLLVVKRGLMGQFGRGFRSFSQGAVRTLLPTTVAGLVFALWVTINQGWLELAIKFLLHTGIAEGNSDESKLIPFFVNEYLAWCLGKHAILPLAVVLLVSIIGFPIMARRQRHGGALPKSIFPASGALFLLAAACVTDVLLLRDHHIENPHTAIKFALPFAACMALLPLGLVTALHGVTRRLSPRRGRATALASLALSVAWVALEPSPYREQITHGNHRYEETAARFDAELMQPDMLFATFAIGDQDPFVSPVYYHRSVYPLFHLAEWAPVLGGDAPLCETPPELLSIIQTAQAWGLAPDFVYDLPAKYTVGFAHAKGEPCPPEIAQAIPFANRRVETEHFVLYVLDQDAMRLFYRVVLKPAAPIPAPE